MHNTLQLVLNLRLRASIKCLTVNKSVSLAFLHKGIYKTENKFNVQYGKRECISSTSILSYARGIKRAAYETVKICTELKLISKLAC